MLHITCKVKECDLHLSNSLAPRLRSHPVSRHSDPDQHPGKAAGLTTIYSLPLCEQLNRMSQHAHTFCDNMMLNDAVCTAVLSYQGADDWQGSNGLTELFSHKLCIMCIFNYTCLIDAALLCIQSIPKPQHGPAYHLNYLLAF